MTIDAYDFVHLALYTVGGEIKGKTLLQKTVYFLGVLTDSIDQLAYRAHFYGPYSQDVVDACSRLRALRMLKAERTQKSFVDRMQTRQELYDLLD